METQTALFQPTNGFGGEPTVASNDVGAMDVDMRDDMDIDLTGDADFLDSGNGAAAQVRQLLKVLYVDTRLMHPSLGIRSGRANHRTLSTLRLYHDGK